MPNTTFKQRKTPGVYVTELNAFPPSIVGVQTAIPGFVGYTEKAEISGKPVYYKPIAIGSLADYEAIFGGGFKQVYDIEAVDRSDAIAQPDSYDFTVYGGSPVERSYYALDPVSEAQFNLFESMRLFFENGGGNCYVVSVGDYTDQGETPEGVGINYDAMVNGLTSMSEQVGPTMLVVPDAVLFQPDGTIDGTDLPTSSNYAKFVVKMLSQCSDLQDRVAILDVYGTQALKQDVGGGSPANSSADTFDIDLKALITQFREDVGSESLNYGMAYFPFLNTSIVQPDEINYTNLNIEDSTGAQLALLQDILTTEAENIYGDNPLQLAEVEVYIANIDPAITDPNSAEAVTLNNNLTNAIPLLQDIENIIVVKANLLPPSAAMAGIFTLIDQTRGVWNAPANTNVIAVNEPSVKVNDQQQGDLNRPLDGKAVDAIREFQGRGTIVWGARTLDGNSGDWRYIQVRRTLIYIEQSVKLALDPFVFAANDGKTWVTVTSMVSNFLQGLWSQGGLMGATASEAFSVECGLGSTMTAQDVLEGYMIVQITLQMIRPAEFIELTFKQKMEG